MKKQWDWIVSIVAVVLAAIACVLSIAMARKPVLAEQVTPISVDPVKMPTFDVAMQNGIQPAAQTGGMGGGFPGGMPGGYPGGMPGGMPRSAGGPPAGIPGGPRRGGPSGGGASPGASPSGIDNKD